MSQCRISSSAKSSRGRGFRRRRRNNAVLPSSAPPSSSSRRRHQSSSDEPREPVFILDVRTQNTRLVTPRQRQEIYALNRVMTRLENDKFKQFCSEKGHKGDASVNSSYDIFMWTDEIGLGRIHQTKVKSVMILLIE